MVPGAFLFPRETWTSRFVSVLTGADLAHKGFEGASVAFGELCKCPFAEVARRVREKILADAAY